ncbi:hypothetical protein C5167_016005 [Papaver somniferum]|uniref:protein RADIALIS-like 4 n=1 Tax=Papaver somniferum TaxID=3469 RepID=UPI000E6F69E3|nr:protein RADIALIS-like 4 [Papaver somniferum]RZC88198.1 hypothetical protein C5167_016005 [Papaver somniferum]
MDGGYGGVLSDWSWGENKLFELALAVIDENNPDRWKLIAATVGGKSEEEVEKHYRMLLEDLQSIESGKLDHTFGDATKLYLSIECAQSVCWTDEDQKMLVRLDMNSSAKEGEKRVLSI